MSEKSYFLVVYRCKDAASGRSLVVAHNAKDAINIFLKQWESAYEAGEYQISPDELEDFSVNFWCKVETKR